MANNFRKTDPMTIVNRVLCCQAIKEIGATNIAKLGVDYHPFLVYYEEDKVYEIDWEFTLFEATEHQLNKLIDNFQAKPVQQKAKETVEKVLEQVNTKSSIILDDTDVKAASAVAKEREVNLKIIKGDD